jgi:hypothetical protein
MTQQTYSAGLIIRQKEPTNLQTPFDQLDSYLIPTRLFYIRSHLSAPKLDLANYRLRINGAVRNPLSPSYEQLRDMPSKTHVRPVTKFSPEIDSPQVVSKHFSKILDWSKEAGDSG